VTEKQDASASGGSPVLSRRLRHIMAGVLAGLLVVAGVAVAVFLVRLGDAGADIDTRSDVARVAERFAVEVNNYDAGSVDDYQSTVGDMLSAKFRGEFEKAMQDIVSSVKQTQMKSDGEVLASGVASLDDDSARVLVVADAEVDTTAGKRVRHFRWEVSLVKVDGSWLVDDFTPVA
jgi:Mce-associated membrane protein